MEPLSLRIGWPSPKLLPAELISKAAQAVLADPEIFVPGLQYGADAGYLPLRQALAIWLGDFYQQSITHDRITITGGASQNIGCMLQVFTDPGYTQDILFVAPSYMMVYPSFLDNGFAGRLVAVPEDEEGLDIEFLRKRLTESDEKRRKQDEPLKLFKPARKYSKYYRHIIYCVPTFSNPSSRTMSLARRTSLVKLAREFDALLISDDVYDQLQWPAAAPSTDPSASRSALDPPLRTTQLPRLVDIDRMLDGGPDRLGADGFGNAMSNGSFSKICGPGVRVGWTEGSSRFAHGVSQCGTTTSGGAPSQLTSTYMARMLQDGTLSRHIFETLQPAYASRYRTIVAAIGRHLVPRGVQLPQADRDVVGGYFVWVKLPRGLQANEYANRCMEARVPILAGPRFEIPGDERVRFAEHVRLCFSWIDEDRIEEAVGRIGNVLGEMLDELE